MAKKTNVEPELYAEPSPAEEEYRPDLATLGRAWLEKRDAIDGAESALYLIMKARGVTASKPLAIGGRRFYPSRVVGKVNEVEDFS